MELLCRIYYLGWMDWQNFKEGSIVVDMSSVTPTESILCANKLKDMGLEFIDSPVSGGAKSD